MKTRAKKQVELETIRGQVDTVYYAAPHWSSGKLASLSGNGVRFSGKLFAREGDALVLRGHWTNHPQFGRQFEVVSMEYDMELNTMGLARYLANHPDIKGIGRSKALALATKFGNDFDNALMQCPETMAEIAHVPLETICQLRDVWQANAMVNSASAWLASFELTHHQVVSLIRRLGNNAVAILKEDPYLLVREVPGFGFKRVDKVARNMGMAKEHPGRVRAGVMECIQDAMNSGHCWLEYQELVDQANTLLTMDDLGSWQRVAGATDALLAEGLLVEVAHEGHRLIATPALREMERYLADVFKGPVPNVHFTDPYVATLVKRHAPDLNRMQFWAAHNALKYMMSLISGGAGSGKTFTIKAILSACEAQGLDVTLAAPTGKAAKRMEQMTGHSACTIHRLLGYNGQEYRHGPGDPIQTDVLIVDEMSMVDVPLAWRLFRALQLDRTAVVLVGDHNQLPPVGPGNVLRDLVQRRLIPTIILEEIVRQAGVLKENSIAILGGKVPPTSPRDASGRRPWHVLNDLDIAEHVPRFICDMYEQVLAQKLGYDLIADVQVLTPTHKGPMGTRALNIILQRLLQRMLFQVDVPPLPEGRRPRPLVHDKVIQTRNNYDLEVMNGAVGIVRRVIPGGGLVIDFDGESKEIPAGSQWLQDVELAYALSIHKAQGSEYPCVIAIIHKAHSFQHHRNLFYTAVTRARETVIILGDDWGIRECARKRSTAMRQTFLSLAEESPLL